MVMSPEELGREKGTLPVPSGYDWYAWMGDAIDAGQIFPPGTVNGFIIDFQDFTGVVALPDYQVLENPVLTGIGITVDAETDTITFAEAGALVVEFRGFVRFVWGQTVYLGISINDADFKILAQSVHESNDLALYTLKASIVVKSGDHAKFAISTSFEYEEATFSSMQLFGYMLNDKAMAVLDSMNA